MSNNRTDEFLALVRHPIKFRFFMLAKLPSAFFCGVRVRWVTEARCEVSVPYKWLSQNPFRSTYFACLAMAAEMSTGILAMAHVYKRTPSVSMLVLHLEGEFTTKATGKTVFVCEDGALIRQQIEESIATGEGRTVRAKSTGMNNAGEVVATFYITWSFKVKAG